MAALGSEWLRWMPAAEPGKPSGWRLVRFEAVDADGKPQGKAIPALTPGNDVRVLPSEAAAQRAADYLNQEEGR